MILILVNKMDHIISVVLLEKLVVDTHTCSTSDGKEIEILFKESWDPSKYLVDPDGTRLIEEISRRLKEHWKKKQVKPKHVIISMPGTLQDDKKLISSSRLGIRKPVDFANILSDKLDVNCSIHHDTECLIAGEMKYGDYFQDQPPHSLVYIFVDEGIGAKILIDGKQYLGAGTAGLLGRLIVQPEGAYYKQLRSNGSLEVYSSRPWVSTRLVEVYHSEMDKKEIEPGAAEIKFSKFRQALKTASEGDWSQIKYDRISIGIQENDPIALKVIDNAAKYLGYSINSVVTLISPNLIILAGAMITDLPLFTEKAISYARQFCWATAWNNTEIKISDYGRDMQVFGSIELYNNLK